LDKIAVSLIFTVQSRLLWLWCGTYCVIVDNDTLHCNWSVS